MPETGLRERKKHRTRDAIVRAGMDLFDARGFDATTIADIAEAADIAPRTFFGYFASKEDLVFHDFEDLLTGFTARVRARGDGEDTLAAMRAWVLSFHDDPSGDEEARRRRLIRGTPALQARDRANAARFEAALAGAIAADLDVDPDSLHAHLAGAAAVAALDALGRWADQEPAERDLAEAEALVDEAIVFLRGGLDALRAR